MCTVERDPVILKTLHADLPAMCQGRWDDVPTQNWTRRDERPCHLEVRCSLLHVRSQVDAVIVVWQC